MSKSKKSRTYSPSLRRDHEVVKSRHNLELCKQWNEMQEYYKLSKGSSGQTGSTSGSRLTQVALVLDSKELTTHDHLLRFCDFITSTVLVPNPFEHADLKKEKRRGLFNCTLGTLLQSDVLNDKHITFAWFDYMNSLDGSVADKDTTPRQDMDLYFSKHAKPYTLFAVTLCVRHCKYNSHDYPGGTEVVIMRTVNDFAKNAGLYFSVIPPTGSYGSNMFLYAGVLLPF